jgi:hypothetical protein
VLIISQITPAVANALPPTAINALPDSEGTNHAIATMSHADARSR